MTALPTWTSGSPRKILVATDLSARSDRALDRAVSLCQQWQAQLTVVHVLESSTADAAEQDLPSWKRPPGRISLAIKNIESDLGDTADKAAILIEEGDAVDAIMRVAEKENCGLIVIGTARNELLALLGLGRTVDGLVRHSHVPLLVVKKRPRHAYHSIVVATDFSESSRRALEAAAHFFPEQQLTIFHGYRPPLLGLATDSAAYRQQYRNVVERDCAVFLQETKLPESARHRPHVMLEAGSPGPLLHDYVADKSVDLVVLGTHGRSAIFNVLIGSVAKQLLDDVPCDILVIREPRAP